MTDPNNPPITYTPLVFPDQTQPNGCLEPDARCQAAWYYYILAHKAYATIQGGEFGLLEGNPWLEPRYEQIAYSVSEMYQVPIEEFMKFMPLVKLETERLGMSEPQGAYLKPRRIV